MTVACSSGCGSTRGRDSAQWTRCFSCEVGGNYCPKCIHKHVATHVKRPVVCFLAPANGGGDAGTG